MEKRNTASDIISVNTIFSKLTDVLIKSLIAYSEVVKTDVYKGKIRNTKILDVKLPMKKTIVFFAKYLYLFIINFL